MEITAPLVSTGLCSNGSPEDFLMSAKTRPEQDVAVIFAQRSIKSQSSMMISFLHDLWRPADKSQPNTAICTFSVDVLRVAPYCSCSMQA